MPAMLSEVKLSPGLRRSIRLFLGDTRTPDERSVAVRNPEVKNSHIRKKASGHLIEPPRCQFPYVLFISAVAASVSEWKRCHSLTLAATARSRQSRVRCVEPMAN